MDANALPLAGLKVVEFTHMVMGPSIGVILFPDVQPQQAQPLPRPEKR